MGAMSNAKTGSGREHKGCEKGHLPTWRLRRKIKETAPLLLQYVEKNKGSRPDALLLASFSITCTVMSLTPTSRRKALKTD
jgi:hypothetical protein